MTPELRQLVIDKVKQCKHMATDQLKIDIPPMPVRFDITGTVAGYASTNIYTKECWIRLNPEYIVKHTYDMLNRTIPHEMAHIVANLYYGVYCHHDYRWQTIMIQVYGINDPTRCHSYEKPESARKMKRFRFSCSYCSITNRISTRFFNKILRSGGITRYKCAKCRMAFTGSEKIILEI